MGGVPGSYGLTSILRFESFSFGFDIFFFFTPSRGQSVEALTGAVEFSGEA